MIKFYKKNPVRFVKTMLAVAVLLFIVFLVVLFDVPERIDRGLDDKIKTPQGVYVGEMEFGLVEGDGKFTWNNEDYYVGDFYYNEIEGKGEFVFAEGGNYKGDFQEGNREGTGEFKWSNGSIYTGDWSNDKITGEGTLLFTNGDKIEGFFNKGKFISGVYTTKSASAEYRIVLEDGKVSNVNITFDNGVVYNGGYKKNAFNGDGTLIYENGDEYEGEFVDGKKEGFGTYTWKDGSYYTGNWVDDKMDGEGSYYYPEDADAYKLEGEFSNNRPNGKLDYYVSSTKSYETDWKNGKCIKLTE